MKTLTLTFTDALLSPVGLSVLSGAGLFHGKNVHPSHFHMSSLAVMDADGNIDLSDSVAEFGIKENAASGSGETATKASKEYVAKICLGDAPIFIMAVEDDGSITGERVQGDVTATQEKAEDGNPTASIKVATPKINGKAVTGAMNVMVDYYVALPGDIVYEADITTDEFAGYYYVEADVLVRDQASGKDMPGNLTIPNAKLQSNFTITMASTGDPSTFDFTLDAFPAYTYFDKTKKVLCVVQIVNTNAPAAKRGNPVMLDTSAKMKEAIGDYTEEATTEADVLDNDSNLAVKPIY